MNAIGKKKTNKYINADRLVDLVGGRIIISLLITSIFSSVIRGRVTSIEGEKKYKIFAPDNRRKNKCSMYYQEISTVYKFCGQIVK